ncbi:hypothetical protein DEJ50_18960 [Streptomyces venezuelae]|uniref:Secreted protein n=1 Tax=Streptomyces venezuelae TaxID=54571 RepID=A0A5P2D359_STRVZ|nr:hypothetical protein [Streptomyces venezuelae]QES49575.1 hypothetical protein DEJ50_18960 [Streptomyces venezuelae]
MPALRRTAAVLTALALPLTAGLAGAGTAQAAPMPQGEFHWAGDQGDGETDRAVWYGPMYGDRFDATVSADHRTLRVVITRPGDTWTVDLAAPAGQTLGVGSYANAVKTPEMPGVALDTPSMFVNGYQGGCATLSGAFGISELTFGEGGRVTSLKADYRQECADRGALTGYLHLSDTAPPKPLALGMTIKANAKLVKGKTTLSGTLTCTKPARVQVGGSASQEQPRFVQGRFVAEVDCVPGKNVPWKAEVQVHTPEVGHPLVKSERLKVFGNVQAQDPDTGSWVFGDADKWVTLG